MKCETRWQIALMLLLVSNKLLAEDGITAGLGVQEYWDGNFSRNPEQDSEHYTHSMGFIAGNKSYERQRLSGRLRGNRYRYAERTDLDSSFYDGHANWRSDWSRHLQTDIGWLRTAYQVDPLEYDGKDIVARDDFNLGATFGSAKRLSFSIGGRQSEQTHTSTSRNNHDFDEDEVLVAVAYQTANQSTIVLRLRDGERMYPNQPVAPDMRELDFSYQQTELETSWVVSPKTRITANMGYFNREGETNDNVGTVASLDANWAATEKIQWILTYSHTQPAVGETTDAPAEVRTGTLALQWQPTARINIRSSFRSSDLSYLALDTVQEREEKIYAAAPLNITYNLSKTFTVRLDVEWVDRESPLIYRDYSYTQASLGFLARF